MFYMKEKRVREIILKAMGQAISKTVAIAEIIKVGAHMPFLFCFWHQLFIAYAFIDHHFIF